MVIVVPLISVTLVLPAKSLPLAVVTISPTFKLALLVTVNVVEAPNTTPDWSVAKYLKSLYDPDNVMAEPATPLSVSYTHLTLPTKA